MASFVANKEKIKVEHKNLPKLGLGSPIEICYHMMTIHTKCKNKITPNLLYIDVNKKGNTLKKKL